MTPPLFGCVAPQELAAALETGDVEAFTAAVADFDSLTRLDSLKTALLVSLFSSPCL